VSVIQAYVADSVEPTDRAKGLGWLSASTNAGVALGPVLGSEASKLGYQWPGLLAAVLCLLNIAFAWRFLNESRDLNEARANPPKRGRSLDAVVQVVTRSSDPASRLIWIYAIGIGAFQGMNAILALFLNKRFNVTAQTIGYFFTYVGVISVLTRALVLGRMVDKYGEAKLSRIGQVLLAAGLAAIAFMHPLADPQAVSNALGNILPTRAVAALPYVPLALAVALIPLGTAFTFPCVTALLSRVVSSSERGLYMGVQQTFGGVSRVLFPIICGFAFDRIVELPFLLSAALVAGTIFLGLGLESYTQAKPSAETAPAA
jgi:MFS family permease